jgi:16S rRNA (cytosine1402-N4)-methyltransferase
MKQRKNKAEHQGRLPFFHQPVLLKEVVEFLNIKAGEVYLDATVGGGGHTRAILKKGGQVFGLDRDPEAISFANQRLKSVCPKADYQIIRGNFADLAKIVKGYQVQRPAGILLDLGVSSHQLETKGRGFSFLQDEVLDMRMEPDLKVAAVDLINGLHQGELKELFSRLGEERLAFPIAQAIVLARKREPIRTTGQLAALVSRVYKRKYRTRGRIHPATKVFQALRMAVNDELNNLKKVLPQAVKILKKQGRLVVISFHGLEDKIVKNFFKEGKEKGWLEILTKKPVIPQREEIKDNPSARSAKLRGAEKI